MKWKRSKLSLWYESLILILFSHYSRYKIDIINIMPYNYLFYTLRLIIKAQIIKLSIIKVKKIKKSFPYLCVVFLCVLCSSIRDFIPIFLSDGHKNRVAMICFNKRWITTNYVNCLKSSIFFFFYYLPQNISNWTIKLQTIY